MAAKTTEWRPGPTVCRCCLTEGCYKDISTEYFWMGKREVYADMLSETFDLSVSILILIINSAFYMLASILWRSYFFIVLSNRVEMLLFLFLQGILVAAPLFSRIVKSILEIDVEKTNVSCMILVCNVPLF